METVNKIPLVAVIQQETKKEIAMRDGIYIYLDTQAAVDDSIVDAAITKQEAHYFEAQKEHMTKTIQAHLDNQARALRYDNMMSARSYAGYDNPFMEEAQKLASWCSACWIKAAEIENDVISGAAVLPTEEELIASLPKYEG